MTVQHADVREALIAHMVVRGLSTAGLDHIDGLRDLFTYDTLLTAVAGTILVSVAAGVHQGDTRYAIQGPDGRVGYILVGWGSCSGCDVLERCQTLDDYVGVAMDLRSKVMWHDNTNAFLTWLRARHHAIEHITDAESWRCFVRRVEATLAT